MTKRICFSILAACLAISPSLAQTAPSTVPSTVEEIYIARSLRLARGAPTQVCAADRIGFTAAYEDTYDFHAPIVAGGRVTDPLGPKVGSGRGCHDATPGAAVSNFYLTLQMGDVALQGRGECRRGAPDFPEAGLMASRCFIQLTDPSGRYLGGQLTTNTMASKNPMGAVSDPPGYAQPSIAVIRLWKKRAPAQP